LKHKINKRRQEAYERRDNAHPVNYKNFTTNVLAGTTGKKDDWSSKVQGLTPATRWDALRYLAETNWIGQKLLIPDRTSADGLLGSYETNYDVRESRDIWQGRARLRLGKIRLRAADGPEKLRAVFGRWQMADGRCVSQWARPSKEVIEIIDHRRLLVRCPRKKKTKKGGRNSTYTHISVAI
jgi:hypothetical protein